MRRDNLFHILADARQKVGAEKFGNSSNFYGDAISGNGKMDVELNLMIFHQGCKKHV